jgi:hypothetical protein
MPSGVLLVLVNKRLKTCQQHADMQMPPVTQGWYNHSCLGNTEVRGLCQPWVNTGLAFRYVPALLNCRALGWNSLTGTLPKEWSAMTSLDAL